MNWLSVIRQIGGPSARRDSAVTSDAVVWAIGDVHGRADLLAPLLGAIEDDLRQAAVSRKVIIGLGDYVDRGPDSRAVIDQLCAVARTGLETHFLRGNHEDQMELFLTQSEVGRSWAEFGGRETLSSYGVVPPPAGLVSDDAWQLASDALAVALPADHRRFLSSQETAVVVGDYFFCHAGARPGVSLERQTARDLMWIRADFLSDGRRFDKVIVHGHTPESYVHADARRIGIDTGAYATGVLTGLRLEGTTRAALQTVREPGSTEIGLKRVEL